MYFRELFTDLKNIFSLRFCDLANMARFRKYIGNPIHLKSIKNLQLRILVQLHESVPAGKISWFLKFWATYQVSSILTFLIRRLTRYICRAAKNDFPKGGNRGFWVLYTQNFSRKRRGFGIYVSTFRSSIDFKQQKSRKQKKINNKQYSGIMKVRNIAIYYLHEKI